MSFFINSKHQNVIILHSLESLVSGFEIQTT